jgi:hypothetical protein
MDLNNLYGAPAEPAATPEEQAKSDTAPQVAGTNAATIVKALAGLMLAYYLLHVAERWAKKL